MNEVINGYVLLPCFTVEYDTKSEEVTMTCNSFLAWIFENFLNFLWDGKVILYTEG